MSDLSGQLIHELGSTGINIRRADDFSFSRAHSLEVSFERTIRVSDNDTENDLPPSLGSFPLYKTSDYKRLSSTMKNKGGYFFPMHQREAMWIRFNAQGKFAVKIYVGGVNAVSGEPSTDTEQTRARRYKLLSQHKSIQDYVVTPKQLWLDGIASHDGTVRQFVAMPLGSGYTVEAQITGADLVGGLQIEVVPAEEIFLVQPALSYKYYDQKPITPNPIIPKPAGTPHFNINIKTLTGKTIVLSVSKLHKVEEVKDLIHHIEGIPPHQLRLIHKSCQIEDGSFIAEYGIQDGSEMNLRLRLRGGGDDEMGIAAGGLIKQTIIKDTNDPTIWDPENSTIFNVQILNSDAFKDVTGKAPPKTPVTSKTYAEYGYPYYEIFDEKPSGIKGKFSEVQSVAEKDLQGIPTLEKAKAVAEVIEDTNNPVVLLDKTGAHTGFRPVKVMEEELFKKFGKLDFE